MFDSAMHQRMQNWFETPPGQYVLAQEQRYFDRAVADLFGFNAVQVGFTGHDFLRNNRMPLKITIGPGKNTSARAYPAYLPLDTGCADLILLPHVLEFSPNPHQTLREVHRVLIHEGRLIISGFNPLSLWGLHRRMTRSKQNFPWNGRFISVVRMRDWLGLLNFETTAGQFGCYAPPCKNAKSFQRLRFMEDAGDRWWPIAGGIYFLQAVKHEYGMRIIKPCWEDAKEKKKSTVPVSQIEKIRK